MVMLRFYNLKSIGTAKSVRQGLLLLRPGFHLGIIFATRSASRSRIGLADFETFMSVSDPSRLMTNETTTRPSIFCFCAARGYLRFW